MYIFGKLNVLFLSVLLMGELKKGNKIRWRIFLLNVKLFERGKEIK